MGFVPGREDPDLRRKRRRKLLPVALPLQQPGVNFNDRFLRRQFQKTRPFYKILSFARNGLAFWDFFFYELVVEIRCSTTMSARGRAQIRRPDSKRTSGNECSKKLGHFTIVNWLNGLAL